VGTAMARFGLFPGATAICRCRQPVGNRDPPLGGQDFGECPVTTRHRCTSRRMDIRLSKLHRRRITKRSAADRLIFTIVPSTRVAISTIHTTQGYLSWNIANRIKNLISYILSNVRDVVCSIAQPQAASLGLLQHCFLSL
jgi:hypothetical protein